MAEVTDTGGYGVYVAEGKRYDDIGADLASLTPDIEAQIRLARERAEFVLLVVDAQSGLTSLDETVARMLRTDAVDHRVIVVANKVDSDRWLPDGLEAAGLGFGEPVLVSTTSNRGMRDLRDALWERLAALPPGAAGDDDDDGDVEMKLAIVGKRNAGKSTFINAGEQRVIISEIAGTTRDAIDVRFEVEGRKLIAIDTAGLRKRKSFADDVEYYAYHRMLQSIGRADVVVLMVDASSTISQVDKKLSLELQKQFKPTVIAINKLDVVEEKTNPDSYLEYISEELKGLSYAPIVFLSAERGDGIREVVSMAFNLFEQASHRESTGRVNRLVESILAERGPSSRLGTHAKLFYASQVGVRPPTIALVVNDPKLFFGRYERFLLNRLREGLPFSEVPIRLLFKKRGRKPIEELKAEGRARARAAEAGGDLVELAEDDPIDG